MNRPIRAIPLPVFAAVAAALFALAGCSQQAPAPAAPSASVRAASVRAAANDAAAAKELKLYQDMLARNSPELAAPVGADIVQKFPGTPAAAEVEKTLAQVTTMAKAKAEHDRLANLWY